MKCVCMNYSKGGIENAKPLTVVVAWVFEAQVSFGVDVTTCDVRDDTWQQVRPEEGFTQFLVTADAQLLTARHHLCGFWCRQQVTNVMQKRRENYLRT